MDFSVIFQLRTKKFWWMDVIFYFVIAALVATVLCYVIFLIKNVMQRADIDKETVALQTVGTVQQKEHEVEVINYQQKIVDFSNLFKNHGFASQVFTFIQKETRPNVWFNGFQLQEKAATVTLSGESDDNEAFSRQITAFERNKYVNNISVLNSSTDKSSRSQFNLSLLLDSKIFNYTSDLQPVVAAPIATVEVQPENQGTENQNVAPVKSSDKLMIIFKFPSLTDVSGVVDLEKNTVVVDVPFGTNVTNLIPSMVISPKATVLPDSGVGQDFTNPVVYKITAEDGSTQDYTVTVNVLPKPAKKSGISVFGVILSIILSLLLVAGVIAGAYFIYKKRLNNKPKI